MAVNANKLLSARNFAERCQLAGPAWRVDNSKSGSEGRDGASHFPLLQQKEAFSPYNKSVPHVEHVLFQTGMVQRLQVIDLANVTHQPVGGSASAVGCLFLSERKHKEAMRELYS
jgi:hypothetical protein